MPRTEIDEIRTQESLMDQYEDIDDTLPDWIDEDKHLSDYPGEIEIDVHYSEEYCELRSIGLSHPQAEEVIQNVH